MYSEMESASLVDTMDNAENEPSGTVVNVNLRSSLMSNMSSLRDSTFSAGSNNVTKSIATRAGNFTDHYELLEDKALHKSRWASVYLCRHKKATRQQRIVKIIKETCSYCHEYEMLRQLDHPALPVVYELFQSSSDEKKEEHEFYMVMRHYQGESLQHASQKSCLMSEVDAARIIFELLSCLNYLHHQQLVHCAVRPENILLRLPHRNNRTLQGITLLDFTYSFPMEAKKMNYIRGNYQGHDICYLAPEILQEIPAYDHKCDIWACGVLLYRVLSDTLPFVLRPDDDSEDIIRNRILKGELLFPDDPWATISHAAKDLVRSLLTQDSNKRFSAAMALQHLWLTEHRNHVLKALDPSTISRAPDSLNILGNVRKYPTAILALGQQHTKQKQPLDLTTDHTHDDPNTTHHAAVFKLRQAIAIVMVTRLLPEDETHKIDRIFHAIDTNHNGQIDPRELRAGYYHAFRRMMPEFDLLQIFQQFHHHHHHLDAVSTGHGDLLTTAANNKNNNNNIVLNYSEFKCAAVDEQTLMTEERLQEVFDLLDKYSKRSIGVMELSDAFPYEYQSHLGMEDFIAIVDQVDSTGKGGINFEDFYRMMMLQPLHDDAATA
jgi:serine/threonine protein kinase/Ca2+-binding EF-hand superfamily protein